MKTPSFPRLLTATLCGALLCSAPSQAQSKSDSSKPHIDVVFVVDCSGSMGPVIDTAKQKVWEIVNQIAKAKPSPVLRIGLYAYGNGTQDIRKYALSDDLDTVYEHLMTFKDEGWSEEYVGLLVKKATDEMDWTEKRAGVPLLKAIYVVGNETARQGPTDYTNSAPAAAKRGVRVNAIFCGQESGQETWREMAKLGQGEYLEIAASGGNITIPTPYDDQLSKLNTQLNSTYLAYGSYGAAGAANQSAQDANSYATGGSANVASRAAAKSTRQYSNSRWDLVDAAREKKVDVAKAPAATLPAEMQKMTPTQRKTYVEKKSTERSKLQKQISELARKRDAYIQTEIKKRGLNQNSALDAAVRRSVVNGAMKGGFRF